MVAALVVMFLAVAVQRTRRYLTCWVIM